MIYAKSNTPTIAHYLKISGRYSEKIPAFTADYVWKKNDVVKNIPKRMNYSTQNQTDHEEKTH